MGRWPPDSAQRLKAAALELFAERGFSHVTSAEIAKRIGMSERTFFRHFKTKEDVLFEDYSDARLALQAFIGQQPADTAMHDLMRAIAGFFESRFEPRRPEHQRMAAVVAGEPVLRRRMLLYEHDWVVAIAKALEARGFPPDRAQLLAATTAATFRIAYDDWVARPAGPGLGARFDALVSALGQDLTSSGGFEDRR